MKCWNCSKVAKGICIFCGRAVCKTCAKRNPNILGAFDEVGDNPKLLTVNNALWCGKCQLVNQAVDIPELEGKEIKIRQIKAKK